MLWLGLHAFCICSGQETFDGPSSPAQWPKWYSDLKDWRFKTTRDYNLTGAIYDNPNLKWTQTSYVQAQVHTFDRFLYDPVTRNYTVDRYLEDVESRYGGLDSVLLWHTYPNIGVDNRNQYELTLSMPGQRKALRDLVARFHARGVRVLLPFNPWDQGTHDVGVSDPQAVAELLLSVQADGINGDTLAIIPASFYVASNSTLALEPEWGGEPSAADWQPLGWGYWPHPGSGIPVVDRFKWLEPRRMTHVCNRWNTNHNTDLQAVWFNAAGFVAWENVWGMWNGLTPRSSEELKRLSKLLRFFGGRGLFQNIQWEPHTAGVLHPTVYASKWSKNHEYIWTFVNTGESTVSGPQLNVSSFEPAMRFYDLWKGIELQRSTDKQGMASISFTIESNSFGGIFATTAALDSASISLLAYMKAASLVPLSSLPSKWLPMSQTMVQPKLTDVYINAPDGMVNLPGQPQYHFKVCSMEIEGGTLPLAMGVQFPWEAHPSQCHDWVIPVAKIWMDKYPVTNAQYKVYLDKSSYKPADSWNFLKHWVDGKPKAGWENKPVVWVSLDEARNYCTWAGKRLPTVWEWQYSAQGTDGRKFPWGNSDCLECQPKGSNGRFVPTQDDVDAHPKGNSPFGVGDLVGNVWQYTSEFQDDHTRTVILRGGSNYRPDGSDWYLPQAQQNDQMQKYHLFDASYERAATIGFRCVAEGAKAQATCDKIGLCSQSNIPSPAHPGVDLTKEGTLDWLHWGDGNNNTVARKDGGTIISKLAVVGGPTSSFNYSFLQFKWSDGAPPTKAKSSSGGIFLKCNKGNSFSFTVPATEKVRRLKLYVGAYDLCEAQVSFSLSSDMAHSSDHFLSSTDKGNTLSFHHPLSPPLRPLPLKGVRRDRREEASKKEIGGGKKSSGNTKSLYPTPSLLPMCRATTSNLQYEFLGSNGRPSGAPDTIRRNRRGGWKYRTSSRFSLQLAAQFIILIRWQWDLIGAAKRCGQSFQLRTFFFSSAKTQRD